MASKKLEDLNLSRDEFNKITEALKKDEFRKMFIEFAEELNDPVNRKLYETELTQLEAERGVDVTFINPEGGFVIKTSVDGKGKGFINVAKCDKIDRPTSECVVNGDGQKGLSWKLPFSQAPPRKDLDRAGKPAMVYDVVFHPDTVYMAEKNSRFKKLVVDTACDAVSQAFGVTIDKSNLKFPKMVFKGTPQPTLIRKRNPDVQVVDREASPLDKFYPSIQETKVGELTSDLKSVPEYAVPKYQITHRRNVEYHELTEEMDAKLNVTLPKELVISIDLPLLNSTKDVHLDVTPEKLVLVSEMPAKYKLDLKLPYSVLERDGTAKFDKETRKLVVVLPVVQKRKNLLELMREDSGVECGGDSICNESSVDSVSSEEDEAIGMPEEGEEKSATKTEHLNESFLNPNLNYQLPHFNYSRIDNVAAFTLHVKNVDPSSIVVDQKLDQKTLHIKFSSIGAGFYSVHYAFYLLIPSDNTANILDVITEAWDNNLILQLELDTDNDDSLRSYEAGLDGASLISYNVMEKLSKNHTNLGKPIENDSLCIESDEVFKEPAAKKVEQVAVVPRKAEKKMRSMSESYCDELKIIHELENLEIESAKRPKKNNKNKSKEVAEKQPTSLKMRSISESSSDEHIGSKPTTAGQQRTYKSILKKRCSYDRSMSECSMSMDMDHYSSSTDYGIGSYDQCVSQSHDSDFVGSESCKKTVRFNDKIRRQLFRSDVSILHKRQKNVKRRLKQQRTLERRHSEGSEVDHEFNEKDTFATVTESLEEKFEPNDSGVEIGAGAKNSAAVKIKDGKKNKRKQQPNVAMSDKGSVDMEFKSGMIFDLEM